MVEGARDGGGTGGRGVWKCGGVVMACSGDGHGVGGGRGVWWHGGHGSGGIVVAAGAPRHSVVMVTWWWWQLVSSLLVMINRKFERKLPGHEQPEH